MDSRARTERQRVFSTFRDVFTGKNAYLRKEKAIHGLVLQYWSSRKSLVGDCGIHKVVRIIKALLNGRIFESEVRASKEFPDLFPEPFQDGRLVKRGVAKGVAIEALGKHNASLGRPTEVGLEKASGNLESRSQDTSHVALAASRIVTPTGLLSSQPLRFPYETQHRILSVIQQLLEESCFDFVKRRLPSILESFGWDCAAAGELTEWLRILKRHAADLPDSSLGSEWLASLNNVAPAVARLRHTAVHRLHLTPEELLDLIWSAHILAEALQDGRTACKLKALYLRVETQAKKMEHDIEAIQQEAGTTLLRLQRQKEALARREQQLLSDAAQQKIDIPAAAGQALVESINVLLAANEPNMAVEKQGMIRPDGNALDANYGVTVEEDDIESDEDRLQAELG